MSVVLRDTSTGIVTTSYLVEPALGLYLRENPNIVKVGIATTANSIYYPYINDSAVDRHDPYVSFGLVYNPGLRRLGINTTDPQATLDVGGDIKFNGNLSNTGISTFYGPVYFYSDVYFERLQVGVATVTKKFDIGIGGTYFTGIATSDYSVVGIASTYVGNIGIGSTIPQQKLDIAGSIKIDKDIYDSVNYSGLAGYYLSRDLNGIRWVQINPADARGILVYNDLSLIGTGQSFFGLNFKTGRGNGIGTDPVQAFVNPSNSNIADIFVYDYWDYNDSGAIYRNSNIGINNSNPLYPLDITGSTNITQSLIVGAGASITTTLKVGGATTLFDNLNVVGITTVISSFNVGSAGTIIATTGIGSIGIGTNLPIKNVDIAKEVLLQKALYDSNRTVGYNTGYYQTPRSVLTTVGVDTSGQIIGGRFFDAANMIRLNLEYIAAEAIGFLTSTSYKNPAFVVPGVGGVSTCRNDIKSILKAITLDITKGGNSFSVGAGLSYYNGNTLIHINGTDVNGYSVKEATIVAITSAAQLSRYVINNVSPPISYQSGVTSVRQIKDLTLQNDPSIGINTGLNGCSNVTSAIFTCAGIVTTIINGGPSASPRVTLPDGKIVWAPAGADSRNLIWVSKYGNDDNTGSTEGDAKLTIGAAAAIAQPGDTIMVRSGVYYENNPIGLRTDVSVSGQDLRLVTVVPLNLQKDVFHVRRGCLVENMNFACETGQSNDGGGAIAFPPTDSSKYAVSGFISPGPANEGSSGRWRSPYIRNCTNFMPKSVGMKIDGNHATASTVGADLKSMVCDSFTQYNEAGIGVSITNNGYAQLVSIFTINCDIAIYCSTGGQCDITNSNSSFGNYGLVADGLGALEFTATVGSEFTGGGDTIVLNNVLDNDLNYRRPYDGQAVWFSIPVNGTPISAPLQLLSSVSVINGGTGFSAAAPPSITLVDIGNSNNTIPLGPEGITAELSPTIDDTGKITAIDIVNSGRNYLSTQQMRIAINGTPQSNSDYKVTMSPIYYTVNEATQTTNTGISTVTFNEFIPFNIGVGITARMYRISRILTSSHCFEYIGTGTDINTSTPLKGAVPIPENQVIALNGAQIPFTSTNQKGSFEIGKGIIIDQTTNTIRGRDFSRAIQAEVTPLILALR
jgi:aspartate 1-decarboxylase